MRQPSLFDELEEDIPNNESKSPPESLALFVVQTDLNPHNSSIIGLSLSKGKGQNCYIPINHHGAENIKDAIDIIKPVMEDKTVTKIAHNIKNLIVLLNKFGIKINGRIHDTQIMSYLLDPNKTTHALEIIAQTYLKRGIPIPDAIKKRRFEALTVADAARYASESVDAVMDLMSLLSDEIKVNQLQKLYDEIEIPLVRILAKMEITGIKIDTVRLRELSKEMSRMLQEIEIRIYSLAGEQFNINSPRQLSQVLFERLKLKPIRKTKTGFSTDNDTLIQLSNQHNIPAEILNYRSLYKLKTTYLDTLPHYVDEKTGRIHTTLNQTVTSTGRLSSTDPNLQNIPIRGEWGSMIRDTFVADKGYRIISSDYSQIELRILAHLSGDSHLIDAFFKDLDIHTSTASLLFKTKPSDVTREMRRVAKVVNFGIIYGMSPYGLSEALAISASEANEYISNYFALYKGVKEFIDKTIADTRQTGFVTTLFGRKRAVPDINSTNANTRQQAERIAINTPIQGSAADLIKIAMIRLEDILAKESLKTQMILQIHDELLFEAPDEEVGHITEIIKKTMEGVAELKVPLKVDIHHGKSWGEAH
ncbi:MAG: DNA polymerase I [Thermodesulfovibrionales bacterium]